MVSGTVEVMVSGTAEGTVGAWNGGWVTSQLCRLPPASVAVPPYAQELYPLSRKYHHNYLDL
ncbi:MAG: hypothetical protein HLUCCA01_13705 [Bacteroidetes bacterium HLUCCA01]|nr:MAG: hypothetical protein HLUCCA01_13705 [Bacteroidetes bacterium HLUCCA01]